MQPKKTSDKVENLISLLAIHAFYGSSPGPELRKWMEVLDFTLSEPPGANLCLANAPDRKPVEATLSELIAYARAVRNNYPFARDPGSSSAAEQEMSGHIKQGFGDLDGSLQEVTRVMREVYAKCLRVALRPDVRAKVNATDIDGVYFDLFTRKLGLSAAQQEQLGRLKAENPNASAYHRG